MNEDAIAEKVEGVVMAFPDWDSRIDEGWAEEVIQNGEHAGDGCHTKPDSYWRGYQYAGSFFLGLSHYPNLWVVDEQTMRKHIEVE